MHSKFSDNTRILYSSHKCLNNTYIYTSIIVTQSQNAISHKLSPKIPLNKSSTKQKSINKVNQIKINMSINSD